MSDYVYTATLSGSPIPASGQESTVSPAQLRSSPLSSELGSTNLEFQFLSIGYGAHLNGRLGQGEDEVTKNVPKTHGTYPVGIFSSRPMVTEGSVKRRGLEEMKRPLPWASVRRRGPRNIIQGFISFFCCCDKLHKFLGLKQQKFILLFWRSEEQQLSQRLH